MDWSGYGDYAGPPMEDIDDEEEDFYSEQNHMNGNDHMQTAAGASAHAQVGLFQLHFEFTDLNAHRSLIRTHWQIPARCCQTTMRHLHYRPRNRGNTNNRNSWRRCAKNCWPREAQVHAQIPRQRRLPVSRLHRRSIEWNSRRTTREQ
jgi:hypothetical protein